jgi:hypothetical protein
MANKSEITVKFKFGKQDFSFNAVYYNWVVKEEKKVIAKAPNGNVVTEKVVDSDTINISETKAKKAEITKKWMDERGNIFPKEDIKFYDWEGKQLAENLKTVVLELDDEMPLWKFLSTYAPEGYYSLEPKEDTDKEDFKALVHTLGTTQVLIGEFNLTSRGFNKSFVGVRGTGYNGLELMTYKSEKALQD